MGVVVTYDRRHTATGNTCDTGYVQVVMDNADLERIIAHHRQAIDGEVCSRSRVVDALLDLRLDAGARSDLISIIDQALTQLPGKTLVPSPWWHEQLDALELAAINPVEPAV